MTRPAKAEGSVVEKSFTVRRTFTARFTREADGGYSVDVPDLPGCFTDGETLAEAKRNAREAIECHLEGLAIIAARKAKAGA